MGKIYTGDGWLIKVQGDEHPPVHVHLLHPDGKAAITLDGAVQNTGVPEKKSSPSRLHGLSKTPQLLRLSGRK